MNLKGIKWVVGQGLERCFPFGHKAAIASDLAICAAELSSVMAISLMEGMGSLLALGLLVVVVEWIGRRLLRDESPSRGFGRRPRTERRPNDRRKLKVRWARWLANWAHGKSKRLTSTVVSQRKMATGARSRTFAASYR